MADVALLVAVILFLLRRRRRRERLQVKKSAAWKKWVRTREDQGGKRFNLPYRHYSHPNPSKVIFSNKISISKPYFFWVDKHISLFFFSLEISVTRLFRNRRKMSHNTKIQIVRQLCDVILSAKCYRMMSYILLRKFRVISLRLNNLFEIWISHHLLLKIT